MNASEKKRAAAVGAVLRCAAVWGNAQALADYAGDLGDAPDLMSDLGPATREVIRLHQESPGRARNTARELAARLLVKHGLVDEQPGAAQQQQNAATAAGILAKGSVGRNTDNDVYQARRSRAASEKIDRDLAGSTVAWRQE